MHLFLKCHFQPAPAVHVDKQQQKPAAKAEVTTCNEESGEISQISNFLDIKIVYKSRQFSFSFE